jgi:hypothetical protein
MLGLPLMLSSHLSGVVIGMILVGVGTFFAQAAATGFVGQAAQENRGVASGSISPATSLAVWLAAPCWANCLTGSDGPPALRAVAQLWLLPRLLLEGSGWPKINPFSISLHSSSVSPSCRRMAAIAMMNADQKRASFSATPVFADLRQITNEIEEARQYQCIPQG